MVPEIALNQMISPKKLISRILGQPSGSDDRPVLHRLGIDIVHGCQLRCVGCPNSTLKPKIEYMTVEDFESILRDLDVSYIKRLRLFNFGEPLLHPRLPEILAIIPKQAYKVRTVEVSTNAQHHDFALLAEAFKTGVINEFAVSCDGNGTKEEYERLRPPGRFSKLIEFMTKAKELRDNYAPHMKLVTRTICQDEADRQRWKELLLPLGWTPEFRGWYHMPQSVRSGSEPNPSKGKKGCSFMKKGYLYVDYDGTVVPCCIHPRAFVLGNLKRERYSTIANGEERKARLHELNTRKDEMPICWDCQF